MIGFKLNNVTIVILWLIWSIYIEVLYTNIGKPVVILDIHVCLKVPFTKMVVIVSIIRPTNIFTAHATGFVNISIFRRWNHNFAWLPTWGKTKQKIFHRFISAEFPLRCFMNTNLDLFSPKEKMFLSWEKSKKNT